jgi:branched-chain amino acid transport system ATP-binding protein
MIDTRVPVLEVSSLFAGYGHFDVIRDMSLKIDEGETIALLGPNGAGKTTFLYAIMGLLKHRRGSVRICGEETSKLPSHRIGRGYAALVPEGRRLFLDQTVEDNLILGAFHLRRDQQRVRVLLDSVHELFPVLKQYRQQRASELSGGEQQMVAIGRMLMSDPKLLVLDEPSLGLAPLAVKVVARALAELRSQGRSILLVEQRVDVALDVCDRFYVLSRGEIVLEDRPTALDDEHRALVDAYLG